MNLNPPPRGTPIMGFPSMGTKVKIEDIMPGPFHIMHQWVYVCFSAPDRPVFKELDLCFSWFPLFVGSFFSLWKMGYSLWNLPRELGVFFESSGLKTKDMDVTLSCDTVFGVLDAARKYMVEEIDLIDGLLISWLNQKRSQGQSHSFLPRSVSKLDTLKVNIHCHTWWLFFGGPENYRYYRFNHSNSNCPTVLATSVRKLEW